MFWKRDSKLTAYQFGNNISHMLLKKNMRFVKSVKVILEEEVAL